MKHKTKTRMRYFEEEDILHLAISDEKEAGSVELSPNIIVELNESGDVIGVEILDASAFMESAVLDSIQARLAIPQKAA